MEEHDKSDSKNGGVGMSRAAKKRDKKKKKQQQQQHQQQPPLPPNQRINGNAKRSLDEAITITKNSSSNYSEEATKTKEEEERHSQGGVVTAATFSNKRIKSIIQKVVSNMGVGGLDDDEDGRKKTTAGGNKDKQDHNNSNNKACIPIVTLPPLPSSLSLTSILDDKSTHHHVQEQPQEQDHQHWLESLTAKQRGACLLQTMISPISLQEFYQSYWEKKPLLVRATNQNKHRFANLLSLTSIQEMTNQSNRTLYYGQDLNVTKYQKSLSDGIQRRITLDKRKEEEEDVPVVVDPTELWSHYHDGGCTIRLLCPHKYNDTVQALLSHLETEFQCMVGANAYLTPPNTSQGFAPHYDDIEAFCLQLEGQKRWKVYQPPTKFQLPRTSSEDFTPQDLQTMNVVPPVMDIVLNEGDLLYMPRGWIHQACTLQDKNMDSKDDSKKKNHHHHRHHRDHPPQHSLHLTISAMQQWAWVDLMEMLLPEALDATAKDESSTLLRQGLPRGFLEYMGVMYEEPNDDKLPESLQRIAHEEEEVVSEKNGTTAKERMLLREQFCIEAKRRIMQIAQTAMDMIDASCDQIAKRFLSERQPPALTWKERQMTSQGDTTTAKETIILPNTQCRLVRPNVARLVIEDDKAVVYHCMDNSRIYLENPLSPLEFELDDGPALEQLLTTMEPHWILVNDLFHDTVEDKIALTQALYDEGILAIIGTTDDDVEGS